MRIVQYFSRLRAHDGGTPRAVMDLVSVLARHGHEVVLLTAGGDAVPQELLEPRPRQPLIVLLPSAFRRRAKLTGKLDATDSAQVRRWLSWSEAIHLHVPWDPVGVRIGREVIGQGRRYIVTAHGMLDDTTMSIRPLKKRLFLAWSARRFLESAQAVHCNSAVEAEQSSRWFPRGHTAVLPLICDLSPFQQLPATREHAAFNDADPRILFLGRIHPIKGLERLVDAAAVLRERYPRLRIVLAGSGDAEYERAIASRITETNLGGIVVPIGHVGGDDKLRLLHAADVVVLPSHHENFGLALVEGLASGTPVVASRGVNIWRELEGSGGAVVVEGTPTSIATAIDTIVADRARRDEMGDRGRRWVFDWLDPERLVREYVGLYETLCR